MSKWSEEPEAPRRSAPDVSLPALLPRPRRAWAEIDLGAYRHNVAVVRSLVGPGVRIMAVLKANAYGHGAVELARALLPAAAAPGGLVEMFGVANVAEARALHDGFPNASGPLPQETLPVRQQLPPAVPPIFILGPALPEEREEIVRSGFVPSVSTLKEAAAYSALALVGRVRIHLIIDTGMGRIGVWQEEALELAQAIARLGNVDIAGVATHLPVADEDERFTAEQLDEFEKVLDALGRAGVRAPVVHSLNSAGVIRFSRRAHDLVRTGLMLYGSSPIPDFQPELRPVMTWKTRVTLVRAVGPGRSISYGRTFITPGPMRVATLAIGYADGYRRHLSNAGAEVLIHGRRCAVLGRVTMDQIVVDVTDLPDVVPGEEVVLMGRQGNEEILAAELAAKAGTIAWEIFTGIGRRVEKVYVEG